MTVVHDTPDPGPSSYSDLAAQARLVTGLCKQQQHHVARLRSIQTSLDAGVTGAVLSLVNDPERDLAESYSAVMSRVAPRRVASLLVGKAGIARQNGVDLTLGPAISLRQLPSSLDEIQAVSLIGNLLQNALEAVASMRRPRRRVNLLLSDNHEQLRVRVRDWGPGLPGVPDDELLSRGFTTKPGHSGVGMAIVRSLAEDAGGTLTIERLKAGTAFKVVIPDA